MKLFFNKNKEANNQNIIFKKKNNYFDKPPELSGISFYFKSWNFIITIYLLEIKIKKIYKKDLSIT